MENNIKNNIENKLIDFLLENYYGIEKLNNDNFPNNINKKVFQTIFPNIPNKINNIIINDENKIYKKIKSIDQIIISNKQNKTNFLDELSNIYHPTLQF